MDKIQGLGIVFGYSLQSLLKNYFIQNKRFLKKNFFIKCILFFIFVFNAGMAMALNIQNVKINYDKDKINVQFNLVFNSLKLKQALDNGQRVRLNICAAILQDRIFIWDKQISVKDMDVILSKDMIKNEYNLLSYDGTVKRFLKFKDLLKSISKMRFSIYCLNLLQKHVPYSFRLVLRLYTREVPVWLKDILFFLDFSVSGPVVYEQQLNF
ncbi:MAG: DUF4390 domain-containing protein [Desulfonauticus sp.]|nr:DUF4390 domain-containing protein [Desulfonauticus sp.]